jgi:hypothetical protein
VYKSDESPDHDCVAESNTFLFGGTSGQHNSTGKKTGLLLGLAGFYPRNASFFAVFEKGIARVSGFLVEFGMIYGAEFAVNGRRSSFSGASRWRIGLREIDLSCSFRMVWRSFSRLLFVNLCPLEFN